MMDRECPKCQTGGLKPHWHRGLEDCKDRGYSRSKEEHLHYYCNCGYDFTVILNKEGEDT